MSSQLLYFGFAAICSYIIWWTGGLPERLAAVAALMASVLTPLVRTATGNGAQTGIMAVDFALLLNFLVLAVYANRFWPIWLVGLHGIGFLSHIAVAGDSSLGRWGYYIARAYGAYPMWLIIVTGALRHRRRLAIYGHDPSWKPS